MEVDVVSDGSTTNFETTPFGRLGIIALPGSEAFTENIDYYIKNWRIERENAHKDSIIFAGYERSTYMIEVTIPRFGTGEAKAVINQSVRGFDIYIVADMFNYGNTYKMYGMEVPMSPDDHFANLKRTIAAIGGKAHRITVIMPMLYSGRQHKRNSRESLDCALALQELCEMMGVDNVITFDAHDPRVQNAIPLKGFENVQPVYQMIKALVNNVDDFVIDQKHLMVVSPDEGAMQRCIFYSTVLGLDLGMFYKQRDYTRVVNGRNPIMSHKFLGDNVEGKDVIVVDDMISSGESMIEVAKKLKDLKANRIFLISAFGLFTDGLETFDKAYEEGLFDKVFTTDSIYTTPELLEREWYVSVRMSKYCAYIIDTLNHDMSVSTLLNPATRIYDFLEKKGYNIKRAKNLKLNS